MESGARAGRRKITEKFREIAETLPKCYTFEMVPILQYVCTMAVMFRMLHMRAAVFVCAPKLCETEYKS